MLQDDSKGIFINLLSSIYDLLHTCIVLAYIHCYSYNKLYFDCLYVTIWKRVLKIRMGHPVTFFRVHNK
jgi:hypothetical protein